MRTKLNRAARSNMIETEFCQSKTGQGLMKSFPVILST